MNFLIIYANDDGETRVYLKSQDEAVAFLTETGMGVMTEPPDADPNYWPADMVLMRAVVEPGFAP